MWWLCLVYLSIYVPISATVNLGGETRYRHAFQSRPRLFEYMPPCKNCGIWLPVQEDASRATNELERICAARGLRTWCHEACGERNEEPRVVGGSQASTNAYPWLARLIYHKSFGCGASLINDRFVVSAAHCVKGFMWFMFRVTLGEHDRCDFSQRPVTRYIVRAYVHNFTLTELSDDIALLQLSEPVTYSRVIRPVCLPKQTTKSYTGLTATVAGWGATGETGNWSCSVLEAELPILSNEVCRNTNYNASKIKDVMMCAGYPSTAHKDACTGDSGGPLVTQNEHHVYELTGIVSWGYGCARKGFPGVYTRVTKYLDWIKHNTADACYCSK